MSDLIDRQAVIDAIQKLNIPEDMCVFEIISHIEVAIATLPSIESNGDLISRERLINEWDDLGRRYAMPTTPIHKWAFREFPSADAISIDQANAMIKSYVSHYEENKGEWKFYDEEFYQQGRFASVNHRIRECSICHHKIADFAGNMNFCPNCGADMRGE